eukprot:GHVQ01042903.1.p1 GENE.GHVQ01042903.1~~GHVQ01042903.1.p1  ORF type:complete len:345 (-),score=34.96 GHVQ01042903.1:231-1265(-)
METSCTVHCHEVQKYSRTEWDNYFQIYPYVNGKMQTRADFALKELVDRGSDPPSSHKNFAFLGWYRRMVALKESASSLTQQPPSSASWHQSPRRNYLHLSVPWMSSAVAHESLFESRTVTNHSVPVVLQHTLPDMTSEQEESTGITKTLMPQVTFIPICIAGTAETDTARSSRPPANDARQTRYNGTQTDETFLHHGHHTACSTASTCRTSASSSIVSPYSDDMAKVCSQLSSIADSLNRLTLSSTNTSSKVARDQQNTHITGNKHVTNNRQCPVKKVPLAYLEPHCPPPPFDAPIAPGYGTTAKNAPKRGQQTTHENDCMTRIFASGFAIGFFGGIIVLWLRR